MHRGRAQTWEAFELPFFTRPAYYPLCHIILHGHPYRSTQQPHRIRRHWLLPVGSYREKIVENAATDSFGWNFLITVYLKITKFYVLIGNNRPKTPAGYDVASSFPSAANHHHHHVYRPFSMLRFPPIKLHLVLLIPWGFGALLLRPDGLPDANPPLFRAWDRLSYVLHH